MVVFSVLLLVPITGCSYPGELFASHWEMNLNKVSVTARLRWFMWNERFNGWSRPLQFHLNINAPILEQGSVYVGAVRRRILSYSQLQTGEATHLIQIFVRNLVGR